MAQAEAREHRRARARVRVEYHFGTSTALGHSGDISEGGMFLECDRVAPQGTRVYLRVHLPGSRAGDPLKIIGTVTRTVDAEHAETAGSPAGMGLHFEVAYARTREQLAEFMDSLLQHNSEEPRDIRLLKGSTEENKTYLARFPALPDASYQRLDTLRPPEVERVFAFDIEGNTAPDTPDPLQWRRVGATTAKLLLLAVVLALIAYSMLVYSGKLSG